MYSIARHGNFISDPIRIGAYAHALEQTINPNTVVLDIGTGIGVFALLACKFGARKVYAIESSDVIEVARENATLNGYSDRVNFIQDLSTAVDLPEKVDLIVSDLRGVLPLFHRHIPAIIDARKRFLSSDGRLIPSQDRLWAAIAEAPELYDSNLDIWERDLHGLKFNAARRLEANAWWKARLSPEQLISEPKCWALLDYNKTIETDFSTELRWKFEEERAAHGVLVWFDTELCDGVGFSNAPSAPKTVYGSAFFPFTHPVTAKAGDTAIISLKSQLIGDDYLWRWNTRIVSGSDPNHFKANFKQSSFWGAPLSPSTLRKRGARFVPTIGEEGQVDLFILKQMNGAVSLEEISTTLIEHFPSRFASSMEALSRVGELSKKYGRD